MMNLEERTCLGFPSLLVRTDHYYVEVVPSIGGRIMSYGKGKHNILFQNKHLDGFQRNYDADDAVLIELMRTSQGQLLYGGEKTWLAPQKDWGNQPYVDLDHGPYDVTVKQSRHQTTIEMTSPVCRETGIQLIRTLVCDRKDPKLLITQKMVNLSEQTVEKGLWQVTMLNRSGTVSVPAGRKSEPIFLLQNPGASLKHKGGNWEVVANTEQMYKVGFSPSVGNVTTILPINGNKELAFTKSFVVQPGETYPHGTVVEVYNSGEYDYFEVEVHSPLYRISPGASVQFSVIWEVVERTVKPRAIEDNV